MDTLQYMTVQTSVSMSLIFLSSHSTVLQEYQYSSQKIMKKSKYDSEKITVKLSNSKERNNYKKYHQSAINGNRNDRKSRRVEGRVEKATMMSFLIIDLDYWQLKESIREKESAEVAARSS